MRAIVKLSANILGLIGAVFGFISTTQSTFSVSIGSFFSGHSNENWFVQNSGSIAFVLIAVAFLLQLLVSIGDIYMKKDL